MTQRYVPSDSGVAESKSKRIPALWPGSAGPWICSPVMGLVRLAYEKPTMADVSSAERRSVAVPEPAELTPSCTRSCAIYRLEPSVCANAGLTRDKPMRATTALISFARLRFRQANFMAPGERVALPIHFAWQLMF